MSGSIQPKFFSESYALLNPSIFADMQGGGLDLRGEILSLQGVKGGRERGIEFIQALGKKWNTQGNEKTSLEAFLSRILLLSDTVRNQAVFSKITKAFSKQEGYFKRLFSGESWEEWTESQTALGRVVSHFGECVQSQTVVESCLQKFDREMVQRANEEAGAL